LNKHNEVVIVQQREVLQWMVKMSITNKSERRSPKLKMLAGFYAGGKPFQLLVGYFTSVAKDLNLGLPRTNPASRQGGNCTQSLWITIPAD